MHKTIFLALLLAFSVLRLSAGEKWKTRNDFGRFFDSAGVHGTILLYDPANDNYLVYNRPRAESAFIPASTYKIFNSLVALETGVIKDENDTIRWDGTEYSVKEWNMDHTMRSAIRVSAVWFYQELARRIGSERMNRYVTLAHYGNENTGGGIDKFWLEGDLRISCKQQIDLLTGLYRDSLPFSKRSMSIVKDILIREQTTSYTLRAKTGRAGKTGWYVGYVERNQRPVFFAMNIDIFRDEDAAARITVTRNILKELNLIE